MTKQEIKELREQLGLSQRQFAKQLGVSKRTVAYWESGKRRPDKNAQKKLAELHEQGNSKSVNSESVNSGEQVNSKSVNSESVNSKSVNSGEQVNSKSVNSGEQVNSKSVNSGEQAGGEQAGGEQMNLGSQVNKEQHVSSSESVASEDVANENVTGKSDTPDPNVTGQNENVTREACVSDGTAGKSDFFKGDRPSKFDPNYVTNVLELLHGGNEGIVEVRIFPNERYMNINGRREYVGKVVSGYYTDLEKIAQDVQAFDGRGNIYFTLNPVNPDLLARAANRLKYSVETTTKDNDIISDRWLPIDIDPVRPKDVSSTDEELKLALKTQAEIVTWLDKFSIPTINGQWRALTLITGMSGNGAHILIPLIGYPNNQETRQAKEQFIHFLKDKFSDDKVSVDETVFNMARIWKLYGTLAVKGDNIPERPHRRAWLNIPADITPIDLYAMLPDILPEKESEPACDALHDAFYQQEKERQERERPKSQVSMDDQELIEKAKNAKNGAKFTALWEGDTSGYASQSEADLALCCLLAFWTGGDYDRIDRLFRQSGLYREKWEREDYREKTIDAAIEKADTYDPHYNGGTYSKEVDLFSQKEKKDCRLDLTELSEWVSNQDKDEPSAGEVALQFLNTHFIVDDIFTLRYYREDWWEWNGKCYEELATKDLRAQIARFIDDETERKVSTNFVSGVMEALSGRCLVPAKAIQPVWIGNHFEAKKAGHVLTFENGFLNFDALLKGEDVEIKSREGTSPPVKTHTPTLFTQVALPYEFDPTAECQKWLEFLEYNLEGDADRIAILQEFAGYCFTWDTKRHKFLLLEGEAGTGKSTFTNVFNALLGKNNVSYVPLEAFGQRFSLYPTLGKLANIVSEIGELDSVAEGQLKAFVAGDPMQFERKYRDTIMAKPTARLILATNNRPRFVDRSEGIWRRLILVPWNVVVPEEKRILGFSEQIIKEELAGVFRWAVAGLARLQEQGRFTESETVKAVTDEYKMESNPAKAFLQENYTAGEGEVKVKDIYAGYKDFCSEYGYHPLNVANFGKEVQRLFPNVKKERKQVAGERYHIYTGLIDLS